MKEKEIIDWTISPEVQEDLLADKVAERLWNTQSWFKSELTNQIISPLNVICSDQKYEAWKV